MTPPFASAGRWALVTGASSGIGTAFARALAARGMHLVLTARREERLRELGEELERRHGIRTAVIPADLGEPGAAEPLWRAATEGREIHLLVNNAGFGARGEFTAVARETQSRMVQLNCVALLELAHLALEEMHARGEGGVINVASTAAFQPIPLMATYAATKAFVLSLSEALADESRRRGVRVLALCPGPVPTEFQEVAGTAVGTGSPGVLSAEEVVATALRALERGRGHIVPGLLNRATAAVARRAPLGFSARMARQFIQRMRKSRADRNIGAGGP